MARMYPNRIREDTESHAERRLYEAFSRRLPDDWLVFHGVRWLARDTRRGARDGETDFVVAAPDHGLLVIEVKGGAIRYDGEAGQWFSNEVPIKDPYRQATDSKYDLIRKLREMPVWQGRPPYVQHAVAFPDAHVEADLLPDAPKAITLDAPAVEDLPCWFGRAFEYYEMRSPLSTADLAALVDLFAPSRRLTLPLADAISRDERRIIELTEEQYRVLDTLRWVRRLAVFGCAGTGKTLLAIDQAWRLCRQGYRVLLTCFNGPLVGYIKQISELPESVTVVNFHRLCRELGERAGLPVREPPDAGDEWYRVRLPEILCEAVGLLGPQYDAIVVDEAQDFCDNYWLPLSLLLEDPDRGPLCLFYDDNQNLYTEDLHIPADLSRYPLVRNMRNTQRIHEAFSPFYNPSDEGLQPVAEGPEGRPVEVHYYTAGRELVRELGRVLHRLTREEQVPARDIVVLAPHSSRGLVADCPRIGNWQLVRDDHPGPGEVQCTTIHRFKGLERPVVILAGLEPDSRQSLETLFYVGASRARHHLVVLARDDIPDGLRCHLSGEGAVDHP